MFKDDTEKNVFFGGFFLGAVLAVLIVFVLLRFIAPHSNQFYQQGQIDAVNGELHIQINKQWIYKP